jgi:hypothetical protein
VFGREPFDGCGVIVAEHGVPAPDGDHQHCVWLYRRFPLSLQEVEKMPMITTAE